MGKLIYADECYAIVGACFEVYKRMGCGFLEAVYQECVKLEFQHRRIPFQSQVDLRLKYREMTLEQGYRADFVCYEKIIVELKAIDNLADPHRAQMLNYLHATGMELGLLVNFGHFPMLEYQRMVLSPNQSGPLQVREPMEIQPDWA